MRGAIVQQRTTFAKIALWFPALTQALIWIRWVLWAFVGWPFAMATVVIFATAAGVVTLAGTGPTIAWLWAFTTAVVSWYWSAIPHNGWGAILTGLTLGVPAGALAWKSDKASKVWNSIRTGIYWFAPVAVVLYTGWTLGRTVMIVMAALVPIGLCVDIIVGRHVAPMGLIRNAAQLRRETPTDYALIASQTKAIQSSQESSVEQNLTLAAKLRPILEHPAMWLPMVFDWASRMVEIRIFATPGRTLDKLEEVLPAWSARLGTVKDVHGSMSLIPDPGSSLEYATSATLKVQFTDTPLEAWPGQATYRAWRNRDHIDPLADLDTETIPA